MIGGEVSNNHLFGLDTGHIRGISASVSNENIVMSGNVLSNNVTGNFGILNGATGGDCIGNTVRGYTSAVSSFDYYGEFFWLSKEEGKVGSDCPLPSDGAARHASHRVDNHCVISGIIHMLKTDARLSDCPAEYGPPTYPGQAQPADGAGANTAPELTELA